MGLQGKLINNVHIYIYNVYVYQQPTKQWGCKPTTNKLYIGYIDQPKKWSGASTGNRDTPISMGGLKMTIYDLI